MKLKKIISAAVGAAMFCASLPISGADVGFTEDTLKVNAADEVTSWVTTDESRSWEETTEERETATEDKSLGDVNADESVDSKDAILILTAYAEELVNTTLTVDASKGDVNGDGTVNSKDAIIILQYYAELLVTGQNSINIKDFVPSKDSDAKLPDSAAEISIGTATIDGNIVDVPVMISNNSGFAGGGLIFNYDSKLSFNIVKSGLVAFCKNSENNNSLAITFASNNNIRDNGVMFTLQFKLPADTKGGDEFKLSGSLANSGLFCDNGGKDLPVKIKDGAIKIYDNYSYVDPDKNVTYKHSSDDETVIEVGNVKVSKEDIGKEVKVPVRIFNNPGFSSTGIKYTFDSRMKFSSIRGVLIEYYEKSVDNNMVCFTNAKAENIKKDGVFYYLNFKLPEDAKAGDVYNISAEIPSFSDAEGNGVETKIYGGDITVVDDPLITTFPATTAHALKPAKKQGGFSTTTTVTPTTETKERKLGDVNGDDKVDAKDAVLILKYYAATLTGFTGTISEFNK